MNISIHPSLAGRDNHYVDYLRCLLYFNPPVPRGTGRNKAIREEVGQIFQSTRPSRDGTITIESNASIWVISIHPSLAGRDID